MRFSFRCCMIKGELFTWNYRTYPTIATNKWTTESFNSSDALDAGSNGAFKALRLSTSGSNTFWFDYKVTVPYETGSIVHMSSTLWNDAGVGSTWYLDDRHKVECYSDNSAIRGFWLERNGEKIRYRAECVIHRKISNNCETRLTAFSDLDWNEYASINFLDRQRVMCYGDESMKSFKMQRADNRPRYSFECCKTEYVSSYTNRWQKTDMGGKENYFLDRQKVLLGVDESLRGFWVETSYNPDLIWYSWHANVLN